MQIILAIPTVRIIARFVAVGSILLVLTFVSVINTHAQDGIGETNSTQPDSANGIYLPLVLLGSPSDTVPSVQVFVGGNTIGYIDTNYRFRATTVLTPTVGSVSFSWNPTPASGQGTSSPTYSWSSPGRQTIAVTVSTDAGTVTRSHVIDIRAPQLLVDSGFEGYESALTPAWNVGSTQGKSIIVSNESARKFKIAAHSGQYFAWLGGAPDEVSQVYQSIDLARSPCSDLELHYWYRYASGDDNCTANRAGITLNTDKELVDLCLDVNMDDWAERLVTVTAYAGTMLNIGFLAEIGANEGNHFLIDDVNLVCTSSDESTISSDIFGPYEGFTATHLEFRADVTSGPGSAPVTYQWVPTPTSGQGTSRASYVWDNPGTKNVLLETRSATGVAYAQHTVQVTAPVRAVSIEGPVSGQTERSYSFEAVVSPADATEPIQYEWTPRPNGGQGTRIASYAWSTSGAKAISVTASNDSGTANATHTINIEDAAIAIQTANITGPTSGYPNHDHTFTASFTPTNAEIPIRYAWSPEPTQGQGTAQVVYRWTSNGNKTVNVTISNAAGQATDSHTIDIRQEPIAVTNVTITGPAAGTTENNYTFVAAVSPANASTPVNYTWSPQPDSGQNTAQAVYSWSSPGAKSVNVMADNGAGNAQASFAIDIEALPVAIDAVTISGPTQGVTGDEYTFNAAVSPSNATAPYSFTWSPEPRNGQGTATARYLWASPGTKNVEVTATNVAGVEATDSHVIAITTRPVPITNASINGPSAGRLYTAYEFSAAYLPEEATGQISYNWSPAPDSGQGTAQVTYSWFAGGDKSISVTVSNTGGGSASDVHAMRIAEPQAVVFDYQPVGNCQWNLWIELTGFEPNGAIMLSADYQEEVCATGEYVESGWFSNDYGSGTDQDGSSTFRIWHGGIGTYHYTFEDYGGRTAEVNLDTTDMVAADTYETDNDAASATTMFPGSQTHTIYPVGDQDWLTFLISGAPAAVSLWTSGPVNNADTRMWLYREDLTQINYNDDGGGDQKSRIQHTCDAALMPGRYYVKLDDFANDSIIAQYDVHLQDEGQCLQSGATDSFEPDNTRSAARSLRMNSIRSYSIVPAGDIDWLSFYHDGTWAFTIRTEGTASADTYIGLYDSNGTVIAIDDDSGADLYSQLDFGCNAQGSSELSAGEYYLRINEFGDNRAIDLYNVQISVTEPCGTMAGSISEPNTK